MNWTATKWNSEPPFSRSWDGHICFSGTTITFEYNDNNILLSQNSFILTLAADEEDRVLSAAELVVEWVFVSGTAAGCSAALAAEFVTWSAGNDSGTVCNVVRIVVDIFSTVFVFVCSSSLITLQWLLSHDWLK